MIELERVIDKKVAFFHRAPCNVSQGLLVHIDTRCRVPVPLIDADRQRGVLQKVAVNFKLVCRKPVGDIVVNYAHTYEEQPYDVWSSLIVNEQERKLLMENCH
ncbi:MAG: hypothetical protein OEQ39_03915 [Gammaproteobacteria bacterium]|nr:hypothetical protein [Gammaproteobacteria bacterium]MDH3465865.1 hypothetical protein [Gammaproteobacteria bacterium]